MKLHVTIDSTGDIIGTTPITADPEVGVIGVAALPGQSLYELEIPDSTMPSDVSELHEKCAQVIKAGNYKKL